MQNRLRNQAALLFGALLLSVSTFALADDIQDASKLFKQGQHGPALDKVNAYLANKPKDAQARFLKGLIFTEQGKISEAIKTFSSLTEDYPELPEPYNNLAVLYAGQGQFDKAKMALEMAIRTHPSYATAHENLGDIYAKMASQAYDRALQLDRSNTATQTKLAMIQDLFGRSKRPAPVAANKSESSAKPAAVASSGNDANDNEVLKAVKSWAAAWSSKNVKKYLAFYADEFTPPNGESRGDWESLRAERISKPKSIEVGIENPSVSFSDGNHATVTFRQTYRASHLKTSGNKTLEMMKSGNQWLIVAERAR
jgi:tetratricopeptide (TPR) repeat protein